MDVIKRKLLLRVTPDLPLSKQLARISLAAARYFHEHAYEKTSRCSAGHAL